MARATHNDVLSVGCAQRCDLWPWRRKQKSTETFMRQTGYLPRPPTSK